VKSGVVAGREGAARAALCHPTTHPRRWDVEDMGNRSASAPLRQSGAAAVDGQRLACDETRLVREKEEGRVGRLPRGSPTS